MVGHQHIGMDGAAMARRRLAEPKAIARVILVVKEGRRPVVAALDHVQRLIGQEIPTKTRHPRPHPRTRNASLPDAATKSTLTPFSCSHFPVLVLVGCLDARVRRRF